MKRKPEEFKLSKWGRFTTGVGDVLVAGPVQLRAKGRHLFDKYFPETSETLDQVLNTPTLGTMVRTMTPGGLGMITEKEAKAQEKQLQGREKTYQAGTKHLKGDTDWFRLAGQAVPGMVAGAIAGPSVGVAGAAAMGAGEMALTYVPEKKGQDFATEKALNVGLGAASGVAGVLAARGLNQVAQRIPPAIRGINQTVSQVVDDPNLSTPQAVVAFAKRVGPAIKFERNHMVRTLIDTGTLPPTKAKEAMRAVIDMTKKEEIKAAARLIHSRHGGTLIEQSMDDVLREKIMDTAFERNVNRGLRAMVSQPITAQRNWMNQLIRSGFGDNTGDVVEWVISNAKAKITHSIVPPSSADIKNVAGKFRYGLGESLEAALPKRWGHSLAKLLGTADSNTVDMVFDAIDDPELMGEIAVKEGAALKRAIKMMPDLQKIGNRIAKELVLKKELAEGKAGAFFARMGLSYDDMLEESLKLNAFQERIWIRAAFMDEFRRGLQDAGIDQARLLADRSIFSLNLKANPEIQQIMKRSAIEAMKFAFAYQGDDLVGRTALKALASQSPTVQAALHTAIPFPRFLLNATNFVLERITAVPGALKAMISTGGPEAFKQVNRAGQLLGLMGLGYALNEQFDGLSTSGVDVATVLGPVYPLAFMGSQIAKWQEGQEGINLPELDQALKSFMPMEALSDLSIGYDLLKVVLKSAQEGNYSQAVQKTAELPVDLLSRELTPFRWLTSVLGLADPALAQSKDKRPEPDEWINPKPIFDSIPIVREILDEFESPVVKDSTPDRINHILRLTTGIRTMKDNNFTRLADKLGINYKEYYAPIGVPAYDNAVKQRMSEYIEVYGRMITDQWNPIVQYDGRATRLQKIPQQDQRMYIMEFMKLLRAQARYEVRERFLESPAGYKVIQEVDRRKTPRQQRLVSTEDKTALRSEAKRTWGAGKITKGKPTPNVYKHPLSQGKAVEDDDDVD